MGITRNAVCLFLIITIVAGIIPISPSEKHSIQYAEAAGSFIDSTFVSGLHSPVQMDFSPDGRLFVTEKGGTLRVIKNGALLSTPFLSVPVDSSGERGLLGVAFDPNFLTNGYLYVYYTTSSTPIHNRVSRFTANPANPDVALAGSELQILNLENLSTATNHNGGAIHFGKDGKLYIGVGENASPSNSQSLSTRLGKMLRINSDGTIPTDNPFYNTIGAKQEIWAMGLRNPFTFAFSPAPSSSLMYINDVGQDTWEEIDLGISGANYGWPTCEGTCSNPSFVNPIYSYPHNGSGKAISGAAFYQANQFPPEYLGSFFFGDYVAGFIKRMDPNGQVYDFLASVNSPVDIKIGPDGALYYLSIGGGSVHKVQYVVSGNSNPIAVASAIPMSGPPPLNVSFSGSGSNDPDPGTILSYSWNFGDGSPSASGMTVSHTYNNAGPYTATLTVNDGSGGTNTNSVNITVGTPPQPSIDTPLVGTHYNSGDTISFSGSAFDADDGTLPASAFQWVILFHHNTHTHPFLEFDGVKSGTFEIPTLGETSSDVWYRIYLTVTDSTGLSTLVTRDVIPNISTVTLASNVSGLQVNLDGQPHITPYSFDGVVGIIRTLAAPSPQSLSGQNYQYQSWSDGGQQTHSISTPSVAITYTENFVNGPPTSTTSTLTVRSQDMNGNTITGYWTVLSLGSTTLATGFTPATFTLDNGVQYSIGMGNYGSYYFDHWLDTGSIIEPRAISISSNTILNAVYRTTVSTASISLNPTSGPPGTAVTVTGTNFLANTGIILRYDGTQLSTSPSSITSNSAGGFSASINIPSSSSGGHFVSASDNTRSASNTFSVISPQLTSSTVLSSSLNPSVFGQSVTFTTSVTGSGGTPSGTVTFFDGSANIGTGTLSGGIATFSTSSLAAGGHNISAVYSGDVNFNTSTSNVVIQTVNLKTTTTSLSSNLNPSVTGQPVTFTATVTGSGGTPSGTVSFRDGATTIGTGTLSGGIATFSTSSLGAGTHSITAVYSGDATFNTSTSATLTQTVNNPAPVSTTTSLSSNTNPSVTGQSVTFTATVTGSGGTPSGTVSFRDGATTIGTGTLSGGVATFSTGALTVGPHSMTAVYSGDSSFSTSTSSTLTQTVNTGNTTTTVSSNLNPSNVGQSVTFTATVSAVSPATGIRTGTVSFRDGATTIGTGTLSGGIATFSTSSLGAGTHSITAVYSGDATFNTSTSATLTQTVNNPGPSYPIIQMEDTTVTSTSPVSSTRQIMGEYVTPFSQLVGDKIDKITVQLQKIKSPSGLIEIGVFNSDLTVKKLFGAIDASVISSSLQNYQFQLSSTDSLYTIQSGDVIGIKYDGSRNQGGVNVAIDTDSSDPFDGSNTYRIRYESSWKTSTSDDIYMILEQTHG